MKKFLMILAMLMNISGTASVDIAAATSTTLADYIPEYWAKDIMEDSKRQEFWSALSGSEGSSMAVIDKTGELRNNGDVLHIQTGGGIYNAGVSGETRLRGKEAYPLTGTYTITANVERNAMAFTWKAQRQVMVDLFKRCKSDLTDWMTRLRDSKIDNVCKDDFANSGIYANGMSAVSQLSTANEKFGKNELDDLNVALLRKGAKPISESKVNGRIIPVYGCKFSEVEYINLRKDTALLQEVREALPRGTDNPIFKGAIGMYGNMLLYPYFGTKDIAQGTALRPETVVYATCTTTATVLSVGGATLSPSEATPNYTEFFASTGSLTVDGETMDYSAKTANSFTVSRSGGGTGAAQHVPGALVTERDVATVIAFGGEAILRVNGDQPKFIKMVDDYDMDNGLGVMAYFGQSLAKNYAGKASGIVTMKVYSPNPYSATSTL